MNPTLFCIDIPVSEARAPPLVYLQLQDEPTGTTPIMLHTPNRSTLHHLDHDYEESSDEETDSEYESDLDGSYIVGKPLPQIEETDDLPELVAVDSGASDEMSDEGSSSELFVDCVNEKGHPICLGRGSCGYVTQCIWKSTGKVRAIKRVTKHHPSVEQLQNEFQLLTKKAIAESPSIVSAFHIGVSEDEHFLVLEFVPCGSLRDIIDSFSNGIREEQVKFFVVEIAQAISVLHNHTNENGVAEPIMHNDIKPANILLDENGNVKLCDFGLSKQLASVSETFKKSQGTVRYFSPEKYKQYGISCDIWAFGCVIYELMGGILKENVFGPTRFNLDELREKYSDECLDFVRKCVDKDPAARWNVNELLSHSFCMD